MGSAARYHRDLRAGVAAAAADRGAYQNMTLSVDVPSAASCTGDRVVLDGRDVALLRVSLVDSDGHPTGAGGPVNVSFEVVSGPGRVVGVGNSDLSTHQRPQGRVIETVRGLARGVVQVTLDCTTTERVLATEIDSRATGRTSVVASCPSPLPEIVVRATAVSPSSPTLAPATVRIVVSDDPGTHSALAVARRSEPCTFDRYIDSFYLT